ncbi:MAG: HNH endonuclease [Sphingobacteriales bacterium]|nr:HNH endonuclease [Sphingobacteriales bacterium]MBI3718326.1 HNH endonuclease [Sphingobacteriales bacterium]
MIVSSQELVSHIKKLHLERKDGKARKEKRKSLTHKERVAVLEKTNYRCHICGTSVTVNDFQADHVKSYISGGNHAIDNYLPSCFTCNNYKWHYLPEEIQMILKLGVWAKTQIEKETLLGKNIAEGFVKHEQQKLKRKSEKIKNI